MHNEDPKCSYYQQKLQRKVKSDNHSIFYKRLHNFVLGKTLYFQIPLAEIFGISIQNSQPPFVELEYVLDYIKF